MFVSVDKTGKGHSAEVNRLCFLSNGASNLAEHLVSSSTFCGCHCLFHIMWFTGQQHRVFDQVEGPHRRVS